MDIAIISINKEKQIVKYAGAKNPLYLVREGNLIEYKADRMPITFSGEIGKYSNHFIDVKSGDALYLFSDGYADQFGGPNNKKFGYAKLRSTLSEITNISMSDQNKHLESEFEIWKGGHSQVDDVLVIGVRI
jgi:serine phosphatase RsbU (regulator of sigma subunit)